MEKSIIEKLDKHIASGINREVDETAERLAKLFIMQIEYENKNK